MAFLFGSKGADPRAQAKYVDRGLRRNGREIDRELRKMQQLERQTMAEVKKLAAARQTGPAKMMAKNIVQLRKQKEKMYQGKAQLSGVAMANKSAMASQAVMKGMAVATQAMAQQSATMNPQQMMQMAQDFERESAKMEIQQEMLDDAMESALGGSDDEEEADEVTQAIFDELNIEMFSKAGAVPTVPVAVPAAGEIDVDDIMARIAALKQAA